MFCGRNRRTSTRGCRRRWDKLRSLYLVCGESIVRSYVLIFMFAALESETEEQIQDEPSGNSLIFKMVPVTIHCNWGFLLTSVYPVIRPQWQNLKCLSWYITRVIDVCSGALEGKITGVWSSSLNKKKKEDSKLCVDHWKSKSGDATTDFKLSWCPTNSSWM